MGTGDPASDVNVVWSLFPLDARETFRRTLAFDDVTWSRARGLALAIALAALPYYQHADPNFTHIARYTIDEILAGDQRGA